MKSRIFLGLAMLFAFSDSSEAVTLADLRTDYVSGTSAGDDASFTGAFGTWVYQKSDTANPSSGGSNLVTLEWRTSPGDYVYLADANFEPMANIINGSITSDEVFFHTNNSPRYVVARWLSTISSPISIDGHVRDLAAGGDGINFEIFVNGTSVSGPTLVNSSTFNFSLNQTVNAGEYVDFVMDARFDADFDSTGLAVTLVPEPSLGAFAAVGLCAFAYYRRRARC